MTDGESIQIEKGKFARIHNDILSALAIARFTGSEYRCLLFLFRMTYGWQKKEDTISISQWATGIGIEFEKRHNAWRILQGLIEKRVIYARDNGNNRPMTWGFNKYTEQWDKSLFLETVISQDNSFETVISQDNTTVISGDNTTVIPQDNNKRKERKIKELPESDEPTLPASSLADRFHALIDKLRDGNNKPATLREVYILCYGETGAPAFSYLGKAAREVGGAGYLAQRMFELVTRPPNGDVIAYILGEHRNKKNRANGYGKDAPTSNSSWIELETEIPEYMRT